jgi:hypothetical protein
MLAKQALYPLSHTPSHLVTLQVGCCGELFAGLPSNCDPPNLSLPSRQDYRCEPLVPSKEGLWVGKKES